MLQKIENQASELLQCFRQIYENNKQYIINDVQSSKTVQDLNEELDSIFLMKNNEINNQRLINQLMQQQEKLQQENHLLQKNTNEQVIKENIQLQIQVRQLTEQVQNNFIMTQDYQNQRETLIKIQEENSSLLSQLIHYESVIDKLKKEIYNGNAKIQQQKQEIYGYIKEQNALKLSIFDLTQQQQLKVNENVKTTEMEVKIQQSNQQILDLQNENIKLSQLIQQSINNLSKFKIDQDLSIDQVDYLFQQLEQISKENQDLKESINVIYRNYQDYIQEKKTFAQIIMIDIGTQVEQDLLNINYLDKNVQTDAKIKAITMLSNKEAIIENLKQKDVEVISQACQTDPLTLEKYSIENKDKQFNRQVQQTPQIYRNRAHQSSIRVQNHNQDNNHNVHPVQTNQNDVTRTPTREVKQQESGTPEPDFNQYQTYVDQRVTQYRDIIDKFINGLDDAVVTDSRNINESMDIIENESDELALSGMRTPKRNEASALQQLNFDNKRLVELLKQLRAQFEMSEEQHSATVYQFQGLQKKFIKALNMLQKYEDELKQYKAKEIKHNMILDQNQGFISDLRTTLQKTTLQRSEAIRERQKLKSQLVEYNTMLVQVYRLING